MTSSLLSPALVNLSSYVAEFSTSPLAPWAGLEPWNLIALSDQVVRSLLASISSTEFVVNSEVAVHRTTVVESGAVLKGPLILGAHCFVGAGAYLRGGNWIAQNCTLGPGTEVKSSFVFTGTKVAHFNFVGDSILGANVNLEAGSVICNHRNERPVKEVLVRVASGLHRTGCEKFGALVGDGSRIGANAVIAPGALLLPGANVGRTALCDQELG